MPGPAARVEPRVGGEGRADVDVLARAVSELPGGARDLVADFAELVQPVADVTAFWVGGSLATGDYQPGRSDLDLVALVAAPLRTAQQDQLTALHTTLLAEQPLAAGLHCAYLPRHEVADVAAAHLCWAHRELFRRPVTGVARAELLRFGVTVYGPEPVEVLPPVSEQGLRDAARAELSGYWAGAVRKPYLWLQDVYVDLGLITLVRVEATLADGTLLTKGDALPRLSRFGVPPELVAEIGSRRRGEPVRLTAADRVRRAGLARRLMADGIARLAPG